jgi:hypothetical protein
MRSIAARTPRRIILTEKKAGEIYSLKPSPSFPESTKRGESQSRLVAEKYGVSPKTVRDIWNRKTWIAATLHMSGSLWEEV